uniref:Fibronectin type-III domain-containing protein n=1 Tax=Leptobrachium leishanense TaxID=445787 RepID=A0A8C5WJN7_9ANUR
MSLQVRALTSLSAEADGLGKEKMAIEIPALGRPFTLGMLYDCRNETPIPAITFWKKEMLEKDVQTTLQENTSFDILASDTISDKSAALNIRGSLKTSILCGLVSVLGSGNFLNDVKTSQKQIRVILKYFRSTKYTQLSMSHLCTGNLSYHDGFHKGTATHVVTGILYGAQAFFVFDQDIQPRTNSKELQGNLELMVGRIPQIAANPKHTDISKESLSQFSCKFHGDFALDKNPVSYEDAINIYTNLPKLLGPKGEKAVPVKVWLHPLDSLDSRAAQLVREIGDTLVFRAEKIIQQMTEVNMHCNDLMRHPAAENFPDMKSKVSQFREHCDQFTLVLRKKLAQTLPSIRGGETDEEELEKILAEKEASPFRHLDICDFLVKREREMDFVNALLDALPKIQVVPTLNKLSETVSKQDTDYIVCLNLSSLRSVDPYLLDTHDWLNGKRVTGGEVYAKSEASQWFEEVGMTKKVRLHVKEFQAFASTNTTNTRTQFVISSLPDKNNPGISIYLYEEGDLVSTTFEPPSKPDVPLITNRDHQTMELALQPADFGRECIESFKVEYKCVDTDVWNFLNAQKSETEKIVVSGLHPNTLYHFRCSAVCKAGHSLQSEVTGLSKTLPTSPPRTPRVISEINSLILFWRTPSTIAAGVHITQYRVQYKEKDENTWREETIEGNVQSNVIKGLKEKTAYHVRVRAVCGGDGEGVPSEVVEYKTSEDTVTSPAHRMLQESKILRKQWPPIYRLPTDSQASRHQTFTLGKENSEIINRVILLLGETGSGKSALIDGMANYILGVDFNDDFRFKLVQESDAQSRTCPLTVYKLNHERGYKVPYSLTVIDSPEVGDTSEAISTFLKDGNDQIDAVCMVVQASLAQLSHTQAAVFQLIYSSFGKINRENILFLITFSDGERPPVLEAIRAAGIPCSFDRRGDPPHIKCNNSALFVENNEEDTKFNQGFWVAGEESMRTFFWWLNTREAKSLSFSKDVLCGELGLEATLKALQVHIEAGLSKMDTIREAQKELEANQKIEATYKGCIPKRERVAGVVIPIDDFLINCHICDSICHFLCQCKVTDEDLSKCSSMDKQGKCLNCPGKCKWQLHFIERYTLDMVQENVEDTDLETQQIFEKACKAIRRLTDMICCLQEEHSTIKEDIDGILDQYCTELERLHGIHLSKDFFRSLEDITRMIHSEEQGAQAGHHQRVQALKQAREMSHILQNIMQ